MDLTTHRSLPAAAPDEGGPPGVVRPYYPQLDGVRALAAVAVIVAHHQPPPTPSGYWSAAMALVADTSIGATAVVVFFALSAFLLSGNLCREYDASGEVDRASFLLRRAKRILPLYFVAVIVIGLLLPDSVAMIDPHSRLWVKEHLWMFLALVANYSLAFGGSEFWSNQFGPPLNTLWTIAVEMHFYVALAVLFPWFMRARRTGAIFACLFAAGVFGRAVWFLIPELKPIALNLYVASTSYIDLFCLAAAAGIVWTRRSDAICRLLQRRGAGIAVGAVNAALYTAICYPFFGASRWTIIFAYGFLGSSFALAMIWLVANPDATLSRLLGCRVLRVGGILSYGAYVWHMPIEAAFRKIFVPWSDAASFWTLPLVIATSFAAAAITYYSIELPPNRLLPLLRRARSHRLPREKFDLNSDKPDRNRCPLKSVE
jgi:peptidoglycan/LPS O-acetylase OafA/YrhL